MTDKHPDCVAELRSALHAGLRLVEPNGTVELRLWAIEARRLLDGTPRENAVPVGAAEAPYAYAARNYRDDASVCPTLAAAVASARASAVPSMATITAHFRDGRAVDVPREAYQRPRLEAEVRAEAEAFVAHRARLIAEAQQQSPGVPMATLRGLARCNPDNSPGKQIADYIRTAPWAWREEPDEEWWRTAEAHG